MKERADEKGVDLLLVDTGDRVEGNGLYDASNPKGNYTSEILKRQDFDVICSGNHELYKEYTADHEYLVTVPDSRGHYLASNIDIRDPQSGDMVPLAIRFRKFKTKNQGIRILSFGFLFDFFGNYNNTMVHPVEKIVQTEWFQDAIRDEDIDLFLVVGHIALRSIEHKTIYTAIRQVRWDTPIQFLGGHSHIRDYAKYDSKAAALESGRYMETIGFMSINGLTTGGHKNPSIMAEPSFARRYIDNNLLSFHHHTGLNSSDFSTEAGKNVSKYISDARETLELDRLIGCAPQDYWLNRAPYPSNDSILTLVQERILPEVAQYQGVRHRARLAIINTGALRFEIFKGPFTRDSTYIVSPFTTGFRYIKHVPYQAAKQIIALLNSPGPVLEMAAPELRPSTLAPPEQISIKRDRVVERFKKYRHDDQKPIKGDPSGHPNLEPGYTTEDDNGDDGDDTVHSPISFYRVPNCIQAEVGFPQDGREPDEVDLIFLEFIEPWIRLALRFLGQEYEPQDIRDYADGRSFTSMIAKWAGGNWDKNC